MNKLLLILTLLANLFCTSHGLIKDNDNEIKTSVNAANVSQKAGEKCSINEKYAPCPEYLCLPQVCEHVGFPQCTSHEERYYYLKEAGKKCDGPPACVCIENYVRNKNGVCINVRECPSCGNDKNATVGCGMNCGRRCSNYKQKGVVCADICYVNKCECKRSYVFDDYTGLCVLPKDCSNKNKPDRDENDKESETSSNNDKSPVEAKPSKSCDNCFINCEAPVQAANKMNDNEIKTQSQCASIDSQQVENNESSDVSTNKVDDEYCCKNNHSNEPMVTTQTPNKMSDEYRVLDFNEHTKKFADEQSNNTKTSCKGDPNAMPGCDKKCIKRCPADKTKNCKCPEPNCECKNGYVFNHQAYKCTTPDKCGFKISDNATTSCKGDPNAKPGCDKMCIKRCPGDKPNKCKCPKDSCECKKGYVYNHMTYTCTKKDKCGEISANSSKPAFDSMIQETDTYETVSLETYLKADLAFTTKMLEEIAKENYGNNLVVGGSSILYLLGQLQLFTVNLTAKQIQKILNLNNKQIIHFFPKLYENITKPQFTIEYDAVTAIVAENNCPFTDKFTTSLQEVFHTEPSQYDFSNPLSARVINDMISMRTNNHINNFVTTDVLSSLANLILVDAQSFRGEWQEKFDSKNTIEMPFYGANRRVTNKPTMIQSGKFLYTNSLSLRCKVLKLNYKSSDFNMVIFLPHVANGVVDLVKKLSSVEDVLKVLNDLRIENVDIFLPRFKISSAHRLHHHLKVNLDRIFNASRADLQQVASCTTPFVSDILQKIIITVDENGGNNAADDPDFSNNESELHSHNQRTHVFKANRPFIFYLFNKKVVLFAGMYSY